MPGVRHVARAALALAIAAGVCCGSAAQDYPVKPIRFIAPNLPGGPTDILARLLGQKLAESMGQPVVIENRAGAGGNIGTELAAKSPADGYTLVTGNNATFGANVSLYKNMGFDPIKDFAPVILVASQPNILVVHPSLPVTSVKELIALAKAHPGELNFAGSGMGAAAHLAGELFKSMAGVNIVHIPYKSAGPALTDLIAGQCQLMFATSLSAQPHIHAGKLRALAVTTAQRARSMPELPTVAEAGVPGFEATTWHGVLVPAGTPAAIVNKLNAEIDRALHAPDVHERLGALGAEIIGGTPKAFADYIQREIPRWAKVIKSAGIRID
ncbi:MAG TPA: tripartite tricarboxylate transporter substrate binding protein [Burkholderiales bacterium]|nr:tripartite tricarboxylate transporter substrate binding protein [Burkholderiales bacterium]